MIMGLKSMDCDMANVQNTEPGHCISTFLKQSYDNDLYRENTKNKGDHPQCNSYRSNPKIS